MANNIFQRLGVQNPFPQLQGNIFQNNRNALAENVRTGQNVAESLTFGTATTGGTRAKDFAPFQTELSLAAGLSEAERIKNEEDAIRNRENEAVTQAENKFNAFETISDEDIDTFAGQAADRAGADANQLLANLREAVGAAGTSGGDARRGATDIELARFGSLSQVRGNLKIFQANAAAKDAINRYQASLSASDRRRGGPSVFLSDQINQTTGVRLTQQGLHQADSASKRASKDANRAANLSLAGNIFTAGLGAKFG